MQQQGRKREIVYHLGLVAAVAEITDIFIVGNVGFGNQDYLGGDHVQNAAKQPHHLMGLRQVNTRGADLLPQVGDGIHADDFCPLGHIEKQYPHHVFKNIEAAVVEIDLVRAEGGPQVHPPTANFF